MRLLETIKNIAQAGAIMIALIWIGDREPPVSYQRFEVASVIGGVAEPPVVPGGEIPIRFTFDRERICYTFADRRFHDAAGVDFNLENDPLTPIATGKGLEIYKYVPLPRRAHPGTGTLISDVKWYCNPVHWVWPIRTVLTTPVLVEARPAAR